jgi:hypothetical protein
MITIAGQMKSPGKAADRVEELAGTGMSDALSTVRERSCEVMKPPTHQHLIRRPEGNTCLSCGKRENMHRRKYCSVECRQRLRYKLEVRTGLLRALQTRYATFYFDDRLIVLNILPYGTQEIYSFLFARRPGIAPADDFSHLANILGNDWWAERRRTNRNYRASEHLLRNAFQGAVDMRNVMPVEKRRAAIKDQLLIQLKIERGDLESPHLGTLVKKAYRQQAMRHHPDRGGRPEAFRRLRIAYEALMEWSEHPSFTRRRGFPDKWFYDGETNRWVQPVPDSRVRAG